jgi:hypothetical protein
MKRALLVCFLVLSTLFVLAQPASATTYYAGNERTSAYGVKANIQLPASAPIIYSGLISGWVGTTDYGNESYVDTGWVQVYGSGPRVFAEYMFYGSQTWYWGSQLNYGDNSAYRAEYSTDGYWKTYCNDQLEGAWSGGGLPTPPTQIRGLAEVQTDYPYNQLYTTFTNVQWKDSYGSWNYFDQNNIFSYYPYGIGYYYYYYYICFGP